MCKYVRYAMKDFECLQAAFVLCVSSVGMNTCAGCRLVPL